MTNRKASYRLVKMFHMLHEHHTASSPLSAVAERVKGIVTKRHVREILTSMRRNPEFSVSEYLSEKIPTYRVNRTETMIRGVAESNITAEMNGESMDGFSAFMVTKVLGKLSFEQKMRLLDRPLSEITAISRKLASRMEF